MRTYNTIFRKLFLISVLFLVTVDVNAQRSNNSAKIDSLTKVINELKAQDTKMKESLAFTHEKFNNYTEMFKQQWTVFGLVVGLFTLIAGVIVPIGQWIRGKRLTRKINRIEEKVRVRLEEIELLESKMIAENSKIRYSMIHRVVDIFMSFPDIISLNFDDDIKRRDLINTFNAKGVSFAIYSLEYGAKTYLASGEESDFTELFEFLEVCVDLFDTEVKADEVRDELKKSDSIQNYDMDWIYSLKARENVPEDKKEEFKRMLFILEGFLRSINNN